MADHHTTRIVQPAIPVTAMTDFEIWILEQMFTANDELEQDAVFYYAEDGIDTCIDCSDYAQGNAFPNDPSPLAAAFYDEYLAAGQGDTLELQDFDYGDVLAGIVARNRDTLPYFTLETGFHCSRPCVDAFGGRAEIVTHAHRFATTTDGWIADQIAQARIAGLI